jgi:hypothetical protein
MSRMKDYLMDLEEKACRPDRPKRSRRHEIVLPEERGYPIRPYVPEHDLKERLIMHTMPLLGCYAELDAKFHFLCIDDRRCGAGGLVKTIYGAILEVADELEDKNLKGSGILFYPSIIEGRTAKIEALRWFRSVWADIDFYRASQEFDIDLIDPKPSAIVRTSGGCHLHYILDKLIEANEASIKEFEQLLKRIQSKLEPMGADAGICTVNHCLRLPGFYSHKAKTTLVELEAIYGK